MMNFVARYKLVFQLVLIKIQETEVKSRLLFSEIAKRMYRFHIEMSY